MSETGTLVDIAQWTRRSRHDRTPISDSALEVAAAFVHEVIEVSLAADERKFAARWQDEKNALIAALGGYGLERYIKQK